MFKTREILIALVPFVLISVGLIKLYADLGGMLWFVAGVYSFIPVIIFVLLVEVYKTSAWANMYKRLKLEQDVFDESASIQTIEEKTENE